MIPLLHARNIRLTVSGRTIVDIDDFSLHQGEVMALIGPNGSGKSSLLKALALVEPPTSGHIYFNGRRVYPNGNMLEARRRMALVFQEALLFDTSVHRNMMIALRLRGITGRTAQKRAEHWLDCFGILHLAKQSARKLSGGEAQRANLARAFALAPELLLLDEPFSALDYPTRKSLLLEMGRLLKIMNMTALFVTHDYTEIPYLTTKISVLYEGKIQKTGALTDIFGSEIFEKKILTPWEQ